MTPALNALLYGGIAGAATFGGSSAVLWKRELAIRYSHYVNSFAAGVLLTIALGPLSGLSESGLGIMMAVAGGSFLYVAASDLIPETHERDVLQNVIFLLAGAGFLYLLTILFG